MAKQQQHQKQTSDGRNGDVGVGGDGAAGLSFEEALEAVEGIIERIERGEVGLEESLAEYERGVALIKRCRGVLERAEQRVEELTRKMESEAGRADDEGDDAE